jgi:hypothetical protein
LRVGAAQHIGPAEQPVPVGRRPERERARPGDEGYRDQRRRQLAKIRLRGPTASTGCSRSGTIAVKAQSMASPRSRLVTWSYLHLCFHVRRFLRPHPDLDRSGDPRSPPRRGSPPSRGPVYPARWPVGAGFASVPQGLLRGGGATEPPGPAASPGARRAVAVWAAGGCGRAAGGVPSPASWRPFLKFTA